MDFSSFFPRINLTEEIEWLLAVTSFGATETGVKITDENNCFSTIPGHWTRKRDEETIDKQNEFLEFRSENYFELHLQEVEKKFDGDKRFFFI